MLRVISEDRGERFSIFDSSRPVEWGAGFYSREWDGEHHFRWMGRTGRLTFSPAPEPSFLELSIGSKFADLSQILTLSVGGAATELPLVAGWMQLSVEVPAHAAAGHAHQR